MARKSSGKPDGFIEQQRRHNIETRCQQITELAEKLSDKDLAKLVDCIKHLIMEYGAGLTEDKQNKVMDDLVENYQNGRYSLLNVFRVAQEVAGERSASYLRGKIPNWVSEIRQ